MPTPRGTDGVAMAAEDAAVTGARSQRAATHGTGPEVETGRIGHELSRHRLAMGAGDPGGFDQGDLRGVGPLPDGRAVEPRATGPLAD
jgi:hypothetical protein